MKTSYDLLHLLLAVGGFSLWAYLLLDGRRLAPTTTLAILCLILICAGLGQFVSDIAGVYGGGIAGGSKSSGGDGGDGGDDNDRGE